MGPIATLHGVLHASSRGRPSFVRSPRPTSSSTASRRRTRGPAPSRHPRPGNRRPCPSPARRLAEPDHARTRRSGWTRARRRTGSTGSGRRSRSRRPRSASSRRPPREPEVLQPHRLVPRERHVHLGGVDLVDGVVMPGGLHSAVAASRPACGLTWSRPANIVGSLRIAMPWIHATGSFGDPGVADLLAAEHHRPAPSETGTSRRSAADPTASGTPHLLQVDVGEMQMRLRVLAPVSRSLTATMRRCGRRARAVHVRRMCGAK